MPNYLIYEQIQHKTLNLVLHWDCMIKSDNAFIYLLRIQLCLGISSQTLPSTFANPNSALWQHKFWQEAFGSRSQPQSQSTGDAGPHLCGRGTGSRLQVGFPGLGFQDLHFGTHQEAALLMCQMGTDLHLSLVAAVISEIL